MKPDEVIKFGATYFSMHGHVGADDIGMIVLIAVMFSVAIGGLIWDALGR
jgi:hypothetical protein